MSEYWKSTPSYWCKFCSQYVRDSPLERKNHDASGKHQNNISSSLRELHKGQERETRDKQRAKDEVARLNGLFSDKPGNVRDVGRLAASTSRAAPVSVNVNPAAQRKAHAEQLAAMGVALPDDLKKAVTGVGNYQVVSERAIDSPNAGAVTVNRSLAEILAESKREPVNTKNETHSDDEEKKEEEEEAKGTLKRKIEDDEDEGGAPKRKAWGSNFKVYPGANDPAEDGVELDALLSGILVKKKPVGKTEDTDVVEQELAEGKDTVKREEEDPTSSASLGTVPDVAETAGPDAKPQSRVDAAPVVLFKKRKGKK